MAHRVNKRGAPGATITFVAALPALLLAGCVTMPGSQSSSDSRPAGNTTTTAAATPSGPKVGPGMNDRGEVVDPRKVEAGHGQKVKGQGDWEGEITGRPAPNSKFNQLKIGMTLRQATSILGEPTEAGSHMTGKAWIPFYFGSDRYRYEVTYKGLGRLLFANQAGMGGGDPHLIWIIHSAAESGER